MWEQVRCLCGKRLFDMKAGDRCVTILEKCGGCRRYVEIEAVNGQTLVKVVADRLRPAHYGRA